MSILRSLRPETRGRLDALVAARNRKQGLAALKSLLKLAADPSFWADFEVLITASDLDEPRYGRRLHWRFKTHLIEGLLHWTDPELAERLYRALSERAGESGSSENCRRHLEHLVERNCRTGRSSAIDFAHRVLAAGDAGERAAVIRGLEVAQYADRGVEPAFAEGAAGILEALLPQASEEERESWLLTLQVYSEERWRRLKTQAPPPAPPAWDRAWYRLRGATGTWGDYGAILFHGMAWLEEGGDGLLQLERTGPFVPPITVPSSAAVVVTDAFRGQLESALFRGLAFRPVVKRKVVRVDWHEWDRTYPHPERYPAGGEPENYILRRKDRPPLHDAVGPLWQLAPSRSERLDDRSGDFVQAGPSLLVSTAAARYLFEEASEWIELQPTTTPTPRKPAGGSTEAEVLPWIATRSAGRAHRISSSETGGSGPSVTCWSRRRGR